MIQRSNELNAWLDERFNQYDIAPASDDASFRRYFRVTPIGNGQRFIVMDAPPDKEDVAPFIDIAGRLRAVGLNAPRVHARDEERGFLLLDDFADRQYLGELNDESVERLYGDALGALAVMQACVSSDGLPEYDATLLRAEMRLFPEWLLDRQLGLKLDDADRQRLDAVFDLLVENALAQPRVFVHRDYHSRNLMRLEQANPGILDFQDAVNGPLTYDLVSLLRDCYVRWPRERVVDWAWGYFDLAVQSGILREENEKDFMRWFDLMGMQRQLKAAGIFARLNLRDGKPGYLKDIPRTLGYIVEIAPDYPELAAFGGWLEGGVLSRL